MKVVPKVLCIEDELHIRRFLKAGVESQQCLLLEATTAAEGLRLLREEQPDVIILDLGLPDMDGLALTPILRQLSKAPIIVLSARGRETDKILALDAGADDYLTKPFGMGEMLARIRVALRNQARGDDNPEPVVTFGKVKVDRTYRKVYLGDVEVHLTPTEYKLLATLVQHPGKVLTQRQLLVSVWGAEAVDDAHYLRVYMGHLRHKLEESPARPQHLLTEPGVGYRLVVE